MIDITIPRLPPINTAGPQGGSHWARTTTKRQWESRVVGAVLEALGRWPAAPLARARVTITRHSTREPDFDNLAQGGKFLLDGLVKAGVIADDSPEVIGQTDYRWAKAKPGHGCVRIQVEELASTHDHRDGWERGPHKGVEIGPRVVP